MSERVSSSGQPGKDEFNIIAKAGYQAVINLAMHDSDNAIPDESNVVTMNGMSYHHIPVPFEAPKIDHLVEFIGTMESLKDKKIWVHCALNYRVSAFLYLYHRWLEMPEREARKAILEEWEPDITWREFMAQPTNKLKS